MKRLWADPTTRPDWLKSQYHPPVKSYEDLTEDDFLLLKDSGRYAANLFVNGKTVRVYRYRWVWEKVNGPIPEGYVIHHINYRESDDRLENLQLLTRAEHAAIHMREMRQKQKDAT